jgi:hypothetical protein
MRHRRQMPKLDTGVLHENAQVEVLVLLLKQEQKPHSPSVTLPARATSSSGLGAGGPEQPAKPAPRT